MAIKSEYKKKDWLALAIVLPTSALLLFLDKGTLASCTMLTVCFLFMCYVIFPCFTIVKWKVLFQEHRYGELIFRSVICGILLFYICRFVVDLFQAWAMLV